MSPDNHKGLIKFMSNTCGKFSQFVIQISLNPVSEVPACNNLCPCNHIFYRIREFLSHVEGKYYYHDKCYEKYKQKLIKRQDILETFTVWGQNQYAPHT